MSNSLQRLHRLAPVESVGKLSGRSADGASGIGRPWFRRWHHTMFEHGGETGDVQQIFDPWMNLDQHQVAADGPSGNVGGENVAKTEAVDEIDIAQVRQNVFVRRRKVLDLRLECAGGFDGDLSLAHEGRGAVVGRELLDTQRALRS